MQSLALKKFKKKINKNKYKDLKRIKKIKNSPDLSKRTNIQIRYSGESHCINRKRKFAFMHNSATPEDHYVLRFIYGCKCIKCHVIEGSTKDSQVLEAHHIIKRADGGLSEFRNLALLCSQCHFDWHHTYEGNIGFWDWVDKID